MSEGENVTHKVYEPYLDVDHFRCSTYIEKQEVLVKGEYKNCNETRGALLVFFDLLTGKVKGFKILEPKLIKRLWRNLEYLWY